MLFWLHFHHLRRMKNWYIRDVLVVVSGGVRGFYVSSAARVIRRRDLSSGSHSRD